MFYRFFQTAKEENYQKEQNEEVILKQSRARDMYEVKCKYVRLADPATLTDHPKNPNKHPQEQIDVLCNAIKRFGWRHPIIVSRKSGKIVAGHCRKLAALKLGCEVPVDEQDFKDEGEEIAVLLTDNTISELAELDEELLDAARHELSTLGYEMESLTDLGLDDEEIPEIPDISIEDKNILERVVIFVEKSIKNEVVSKIEKATEGYASDIFRIMK